MGVRHGVRFHAETGQRSRTHGFERVTALVRGQDLTQAAALRGLKQTVSAKKLAEATDRSRVSRVRADQLRKGDVVLIEADDYIPILMSQKLDEGILSRFWSSLEQPLKPAIQCWTTIPLYPSTSYPVYRVQDREVRFFDLDKLNRLRR